MSVLDEHSATPAEQTGQPSSWQDIEPLIFVTCYLTASFIVLHDAEQVEDYEAEHDVTEREHDSEVI